MNNWDSQSDQTAYGESDLSIIKKRDCHREAFLQTTGQKSTVSGSSATNLLPLQENLNVPAASSTDPVSFPISNDFLFYVPVPADPPAANTRKRSRPGNAPPPPPKTKKVQSESNKIVINWPVSSKDFKSFKAQVVKAIMEKENESFGVYVEKQDLNGNVQWFVTVPNNHMFAANRKQQLELDSIFEQFVAVSSKVKDDHKISCCLVQKDPRVIDERESAFIQLRVAHGDRDPLPPQDPHPEPTEGAVSAEAHYKIIQPLFVATDPCEQLSGSAELHVFINPKNPNKFFPLTMPRANAWAEAIKNNPNKVTILAPPNSPMFKF
ncbi:hypothetical protein PCANC_02635 [Puccinia coronata f. sp. avenae]|uniref:Uncharacterized protein n=1 Tax=Puccinia coronata f. sp. avenae TaxID=200324 RepID=A0A2N5W5G9_9BASI|nr:hypothetical protein PCANC_02635 [Puccinia coronata f. sp. avenae]